MSRPGFEPAPPAWEASTLEKSHLDSLSAGYSEPLLSRHLLTTFGPLQYLKTVYDYRLIETIECPIEIGQIRKPQKNQGFLGLITDQKKVKK
jgi:hypothetical protein